MSRWEWVKVSSTIHGNPRLQLAGRDARDVYIWLLCLNGQLGADGLIGAKHVRPEVVAHAVFMNADTEAAEAAIRALIEFDLVSRVKGRAISILGWDEDWRPTFVRERERKRAERSQRKTEPRVLDSPGPSDAVPDSPGMSGEKRREEKRREEENPPTPQGGVSARDEAKRVLSEALGYLNRLAGRGFEPTEGRITAVKRILGEGRRLEDIRVVIWSKCLGPKKWLGDERMDQHVNPDTILRKSNFQRYLEQARLELAEQKPERARELGYIGEQQSTQELPAIVSLVASPLVGGKA